MLKSYVRPNIRNLFIDLDKAEVVNLGSFREPVYYEQCDLWDINPTALAGRPVHSEDKWVKGVNTLLVKAAYLLRH